MSYSLYILKSKTAGKYYTGISEYPHQRLQYHNTLEKGFTSRYRPWEIIFIKEYVDKSEAADAEKKIKSWRSRDMIEKIISGEVEIWGIRLLSGSRRMQVLVQKNISPNFLVFATLVIFSEITTK